MEENKTNPFSNNQVSKESKEEINTENAFSGTPPKHPFFHSIDFVSGLSDPNIKKQLETFQVRSKELHTALTTNYSFLNKYFENTPFSKKRTTQILSHPNDGFFIDIREWIRPIMNGLYIENIKRIEEADPYEFSLVADALIDFYQSIITWYEPINNFLVSNDSLTQNMKEKVEKQIQLCSRFIFDIENIKKGLLPIKQEIESYQKTIAEIEKEEEYLIELLSQRETLQERKTKLEELKKKIEEGKLIEMKNEVELLSTELAPKEAEHNKLKVEIDLLLKSKSEFEEKLNENIAKKLFLTNASELIKNIEKEINEYQEKHLKNCGNQIEECKIKIDFTKITSSELLNKDDLNNLDSIEKRLNEIDTRIKERLQPQK